MTMLNTSLKRQVPRGFSLLELMIVLALMVGLLAIAWPNMQRPLGRTSLNEAAQVLRDAIDDGRNEAITTGKPIFIQLQNDQHEVRSGAFESFENGNLDSQSGSMSLDSPMPDAEIGSHALDKQPRTWRLPDTVVITEVNWSSGVNSTRSDEDELAWDSKLGGSSSASSDLTTHEEPTSRLDFNSETNASELEVTHSDWWLPISATGHGRSASIVLYDTSIHETLTVTYAAETGALEIVR